MKLDANSSAGLLCAAPAFVYVLYLARSMVHRWRKRQAQALRLRFYDCIILHTLHERGGEKTVAELTTICETYPGFRAVTMPERLGRLLAEGEIVSREAGPEEARYHLYRLTEKGRAAIS